jgi:sugar lactone lactonase YvrE
MQTMSPTFLPSRIPSIKPTVVPSINPTANPTINFQIGDFITAGSISNPIAVSVDSSNNIYVADSSTKNVYKITYPGGVKTLYVSLGYIPNGIAITPQGLFVTTTGHLYCYNGGNVYDTSVYNNWVWSNPFGIYYDGGNYVNVGDAGTGMIVQIRIYYNGNAQLFNQDGNSASMYPTIHGITASYLTQTSPVGVYGTGTNLISSAFTYPICLTKDSSQNLYVADYSRNAVYIIQNPSSGTSTPVSIVNVTQPTGVAFLSNGGLVVVAKSGRVLIAR